MSKHWKAVELEIARFFGAERMGCFGSNKDRASCDFETEWEVGEVKYRSVQPSLKEIKDWFAAVKARAEKVDKAPRLCVRVRGRKGFTVWREIRWEDESGGFDYIRLAAIPSQWYPRREKP